MTNLGLTRRQYVNIFCVISAILTCLLFFYVLNKRISIYQYDVKKDYVYNFRNSRAFTVEVKMENGKVGIPEIPDKWDTALLEISVRANLLGYLFQPKITLGNDQIKFDQYLEYGAEGIRYINVSHVLHYSDNGITLTGKNVSIDEEKVKLMLFKNTDINSARILVLAPHPDDAEIAAYGLYSSNKDSYIITITAGDSGKKKYDEIYEDDVQHYLTKGSFRVWNSITVPLLGGIGVDHCFNLGYFNDTLYKMFLDKSAEVKSKFTGISDITFFRKMNVSKLISHEQGVPTWNSLINDLEFVLNKVEPDIIVTPYPLIDYHFDHKLTTVALFEAIRKLNLKKGQVYLYTNHHVLSGLYPYGALGSLVSVPPTSDKNVYFRSIYSHFVPPATQKRKLLVLEAMNDLRLDTEWRTAMGAIKLAYTITKRQVYGRDYSYFRMAVRNNEFFFVIDVQDIYDEEILGLVYGREIHSLALRSHGGEKTPQIDGS